MFIKTITDVAGALSRRLHQDLGANNITSLSCSCKNNVAELLNCSKLVEGGLLHILKSNFVE